jgi:hypothetical protein
MSTMVFGWALVLVGLMGQQQPASPSTSPVTLDYVYFKTKVQPIFVAPRSGHARCVACHTSGTPMRLQPLAPGSTAWNEEDSRKNFETVTKIAVVPGSLKSKLLVHPLDEKAGGDFFHNGGKHWSSQSDPEWQILKAFVMGQKAASSGR